jgi:hypothetical protein
MEISNLVCISGITFIKYQFEFSLLDFKFGEQKQFHISRVLEIE